MGESRMVGMGPKYAAAAYNAGILALLPRTLETRLALGTLGGCEC